MAVCLSGLTGPAAFDTVGGACHSLAALANLEG